MADSQPFNLGDFVVEGGAPPSRKPRGPPPKPKPPPGVLHRNNTSFPAQAAAKLRELYERYLAARADPSNPEHQWAGLLKYYQYLVRAVMSDPEYGIGADGNARGLLIYHTMGMGKTRLAVAIAMAMWDVRRPVVMLARSLQKNFRETVEEVIGILHAGAPAEELTRLKAEAVARFTFVSMDAYNAADQMARAGTGSTRVKRGDIAGATGGLDNAQLIVDESHNWFRAIINSSSENANARRLYEMAMAARNLRIVFLTGTPAAKDPFELVPCFNMLAGFDLLPTQYEIFYKLYVDRENHAVRNRERLANRLMGLVSHVTHSRPSQPAGERAAPMPRPRDDGWFPAVKPTIVERVEMGPDQYRQYLLAREKEAAEGRGGEGAGGRGAGVMSTPPLALPGSEKKAMRSYYVRSRSLGNFAPPREWAGTPVDQIPDEVFTAFVGPKLDRIAQRAKAAPGPILVYSQFVESGLKPAGRYLQRLGFMPFVPAVEPKERRGRRTPAPAEAPAEAPATEPRVESPAETTPDETRGGQEAPQYRQLVIDTTAAVDAIYEGVAKRMHTAHIKNAPDDHVRKAFVRARKEKLLVSFATPRPPLAGEDAGSNYGLDTIYPTLTPAPRPRDILWLSLPETKGRSWYAFSKEFGLRWADPEMAIIGYDVDTSRLLRVDTAEAVEEFTDKYGVCPEGVDPVTCRNGSYINWARVAMDYPGVAFDPYLIDAETSQTDYKRGAPVWYHSLDAVTYMVWSPSVVKRVVVLYEPPAAEAPEAAAEQTAEAATEQPVEGGAPAFEGHYVTISGEVPNEVRDAIKDAVTRLPNAHGADIKIILVSKTGAEGLDLRFIRETHQLEPYWDKARDHQVTARAARMGSHDAVPPEEREVQPYLYVAVANKKIWEQMLPRDREPATIDELFLQRANERYELNHAFRQLLAEISLESEIFGYEGCRVCVPTNTPLFHDEPDLDIRLPDPCEVRRETDVKATPIRVGDVDYYYTVDPTSPFGYTFYALREDLGGYAPLDPADPAVQGLLAAIGAAGGDAGDAALCSAAEVEAYARGIGWYDAEPSDWSDDV